MANIFMRYGLGVIAEWWIPFHHFLMLIVVCSLLGGDRWLALVDCWLLIVSCMVVDCYFLIDDRSKIIAEMLIVQCSVLNADCWRLIFNCSMLIVDCWLLIVDCTLGIVECWVTVGCWLSIRGCSLSIGWVVCCVLCVVSGDRFVLCA